MLSNNNKIIGIVGSRDRISQEDKKLLWGKFRELYVEEDWICSGGCKIGADSWAQKIAEDKGYPLLTFYAAWKTKGNFAGLARNVYVARHSDVLIALPGTPGKGCRDTIRKFIEFHGEDQLYILISAGVNK